MTYQASFAAPETSESDLDLSSEKDLLRPDTDLSMA